MDILLNGETVTVEDVAALRELNTEKIHAEISRLINCQSLTKFVAKQFIELAPDYFFVIPASSSGKYHWGNYIGGLVDHVIMGMNCAYELAATFGLSEYERDLAVTAMVGHDCLKYGIDYDKRYYEMHPFLPRDYYSKIFKHKHRDLDDIFTAIERHMGNIAEGSWTSVAGVKPETSLQQVVHLADFMSSRKNIVMREAE